MKPNGVIPFQRISHRKRMQQAAQSIAEVLEQVRLLAESHAALQTAHNSLAMLCIGQARVLRDVIGCDMATFDAKLAVAMAELAEDYAARVRAHRAPQTPKASEEI